MFGWKEQLIRTILKAYNNVPKTWRETAWKAGVGLTAVSSCLFGFVVWQSPELLMGLPRSRMSIIEIMSHHEDIKGETYAMMADFFFSNRPYGLMLVSWEDVHSMIGLWVRPADEFPEKAGPHSLTPDMRVLGGPFLFGECAHTESRAMPDKVMVACPIINDYDVWGYVAAIVDDDPKAIKEMTRLLDFLAHRITGTIY